MENLSSENSKSDNTVVLAAGVRTPFAKAGGALGSVHAAELGRVALRELLARTGLEPHEVDEVIIGNVGAPSDAINIARVIALRAGLGRATPAYTLNRNCASALQSVASAMDLVRAGQAQVVVAGGVENMSQMPALYSDVFVKKLQAMAKAKKPLAQLGALGAWAWAGVRQCVEMATTPPMKSAPHKPRLALVEGLTDPFVGLNMGETAEVLVKKFGITREQQDAFALASHQKAVRAEGVLGEEIHPFFGAAGYRKSLEHDTGPRKEQSLEQLEKLRPFFDRKYGSVTVGNACPVTDGAVMLLVTTMSRARSLGLKPLARLRGYAFSGCAPEHMGLGPVHATPLALKRAGVSLKDINLIELNEAFAGQVLACEKAFNSSEYSKEAGWGEGAVGELNMDIVNVNGGAIALGHPVGATGARLVLTAAMELKRRGQALALATLCIGGGQGGAMVLENCAA